MHASSQAVVKKLHLNGVGVEGVILGMANSTDFGNYFLC